MPIRKMVILDKKDTDYFDLADFQDDLGCLSVDLSSVENAVIKNETDISDLKMQDEIIETEIDLLKTKVDLVNIQEIAQMKTSIANLEKEDVIINGKVGNLERLQDLQETKNAEIDVELQDIRDGIGGLDIDSILGLREEVTATRTDITVNTQNISANTAEILKNKTSILDLETKVNKNTTDISKNITDISKNTTEISALKILVGDGSGSGSGGADLTEILTEIDNLKVEDTAIKADITRLDTRITEIENNGTGQDVDLTNYFDKTKDNTILGSTDFINDVRVGNTNIGGTRGTEGATYYSSVNGNVITQYKDRTDFNKPIRVLKDGEYVEIPLINSGGTGTVELKNIEFVDNTVLTQDSIQSAIDKIKLIGGGTVYIPSGVYNITNYIKLCSNVRIIGLGDVTFSALQNTSKAVFITELQNTSSQAGYDVYTNIKIENIKFIRGNGTPIINYIVLAHSRDIEIKDCTFENIDSTDSAAIKSLGVKNVLVERCKFNNITYCIQLGVLDAIYEFTAYKGDLLQTREYIIRDNYFINTSYAVVKEKSWVNTAKTSNVSFINNKVNSSSRNIIDMADVQYFDFIDNKIYDCGIALYIDKKTSTNNNFTIENNYCDCVKRVHADYATDGRFFFGKSEAGYNVFTFRNNTIKNSYRHGIGGVFSDSIFDGNYISGCGITGLYLAGGSGNKVINNTITGNCAGPVAQDGNLDFTIGNSTIGIYHNIIQSNYFGKFKEGTNVISGIFSNNSVYGTYNRTSLMFNHNFLSGVWVETGITQ